MTAVVPFPVPAHDNAAARQDQRWRRADLPENVTPLHSLPAPVRLPDTPERAFIRAVSASLTPAVFTRTTARLARQAEEGDLCAKAALCMALGTA